LIAPLALFSPMSAEGSHFEGIGFIAPELTLLLFALIGLVIDLVKRGKDSHLVGYVTLVGIAIAGFQLMVDFGTESQTVLGLIVVDNFGSFFKLFTLGSVAVVICFVMADRRERRDHIGEYYFLLISAAIGIFFMVGTNNLLLLMLGLELLSLASYSLAGFHKGDKKSAEASMKYVVFGGLSAGIMLYGISLLYGLTGTLDLTLMNSASETGIPRGLGAAVATSPAAVGVAIVLILAGFAYKISVAPFHFWAPDVYEGAPTPVTTFLAVASKAAGFGALLRFLGALFAAEGTTGALAQYKDEIGMLMAVLAAVTMTLGNLAALKQDSVKRMLAYSSIAHAGYVLMGVVAMNAAGFEAAMFYLAAYYFMNLGAFGFLLYFQGVTGEVTYESLKGMGPKAPLVSCAMIVFLISLTGLPPSVGFIGKYYLFSAAIDADYTWLALVAGLNSALSLFYYMKVARYLFLSEAAETTPRPQPVFTGFIVAMAVLTITFGIYVKPLVEWARSSLDIL
jgi:NADH-quinone oxidoreductase subunit N